MYVKNKQTKTKSKRKHVGREKKTKKKNVCENREQALQNQLYGGQASAWNFGAAYRIPDTNINLSGTYQQGKANLQVRVACFRPAVHR